MGSPEKIKRNQGMFNLWITDTKKWTYGKLATKYKKNKRTVYDIIKRELRRRGVDKVPTQALDKPQR